MPSAETPKQTSSAASLSAVAQHFGISRTAARDLEIQGIINRAEGLDCCRLRYLQHLRARRSNGSAADAAYREARAREIEVRTAERLGRYVAREEFDAMIDALCGMVRAELSGLPARIARGDLALRRIVEAEVNGVLHRLADAAERQAAAHDG